MNLTSLFMNTLRNETPWWTIRGDCPDDFREEIDNLMLQYYPRTVVGGGWNYWVINAYDDGYVYATRFTWDSGFGGTWEDVKAKIVSYHSKMSYSGG